MVNSELLYWFPGWGVALGFLVGLVIAVELGFRAGRRHYSTRDKGDRPDLGTIQGAVLGLLGLLLAFTYSFAAARADTRKTAALEEANVIGTAYLRVSLLAEPTRGELRAVLRDYVDSRLVDEDVHQSPESLQQAVAHSEQVQSRLWPLLSRYLEGRTATPIDALVVQSINEVIDMHARRVAGWRDRVPEVILLMLFFVGLVSMGLAGYACGVAGRRNAFFTTTLALLVAVVVMLIIDLDHPRSGFIQVSQQAMIDLQQSMRVDQQ